MKIESDHSESTMNELELDHDDSVNTNSSGDWVMSKPTTNEVSTTIANTNTNTTTIVNDHKNDDITIDENKDKSIHQIADKELFLRAIEAGNLTYIKEYMKSMDDEDIDEEMHKGKTMLHYACIYGSTNTVQYMLQGLQADITITSMDGKNALHHACDYGNMSVVRFLLDHDLSILNCKQTDGSTALHIACSRGHMDIVKHLLTMNDIDATLTQNDGWTILHEAVRNGHCDIVDYILNTTKIGTNSQLQLIGMLANDGKLALHYACRNGYFDIVQRLLQDDHTTVGTQDQNGWNALHFAARYNHLDIVHYLINVCKARMDQGTKDGMIALYLATINGHFDIVKCMLPLMQKRDQIITPAFKGIYINCGGSSHTDVHGNVWEADETNKYFSGGDVQNTAGMFVFKTGVGNIALYQQHRHGKSFSYYIPSLPNGYYYVKIFYIRGSSLNIEDFNVQIDHNVEANPMHCTTYTGKIIAAVKTLVTNVTGKELKIKISSSTNACISKIAVIPILLEPASTTSKAEVEAYHYASMHGWLNIVKLYSLKLIIPLEFACNGKQNALRIAIRYDQIEIVEYLLHHYDDVVDSNITHLQYASMYGSIKSVKYLLGVKETSINETKKDNWTALHFASRNGHLDVVECLIKVGAADIELQTSIGCTALHLAARYGHLTVVQYLIWDSFAKVDAETNDGLTALHFATLHGYYDVVQYLLKDANANAGAKAKEGLTALHLAGTQSNINSLKIAKLLLEYPSSNTKNSLGESPLDYSIRIMKKGEFSVYMDESDTNDTILLLQQHTSESLSDVVYTFDTDAHK